MGEYRKFYLTNGNGNSYALTDKNFSTERDFKKFLNSPKGLGFQKTVNTKRIGNHEVLVNSSYNMPSITGEILFYDENVEKIYEAYFEFINFISIEPIQLHYLPPNTTEVAHIDCIVIKGEKSEIENNTGVLRVPVTFQGTSLWIVDKRTETGPIVKTFVDEGKYHDLVYPYNYSGISLSNIQLNNESTNEIGFIFEVNGLVTNPQFTIYQNGAIYGTCKLIGTFDYVMVDSTDLDENIILELNGSRLSNPSSYQDLTIINGGDLTFIKLRPGVSNAAFTCYNIDTFSGNVQFKYNREYISY